jgi:hypothetical protein
VGGIGRSVSQSYIQVSGQAYAMTRHSHMRANGEAGFVLLHVIL